MTLGVLRCVEMKHLCAAALFVLASARAQTVPEYIHGDECLFCHRNDIGPAWQTNPHGTTIRQREDAPELAAAAPEEAQFIMGGRGHIRYLKKEGYGRFAILEDSRWNRDKFADRCAGCHTTGVDPKTRTFSAFGLDCYVCHGVVNLRHTGDTSLIFLSKKRRNDVRAITSTCAQCHLRTAKSRSTGLPYPNNFVAGDDLFQDYQVDFSKADDPNLNPGDRHIIRNVRDVVSDGANVTCLSCHRVHASSSAKHRLVLSGPICLDCHNAQGPRKAARKYTVHSPLCEY